LINQRLKNKKTKYYCTSEYKRENNKRVGKMKKKCIECEKEFEVSKYNNYSGLRKAHSFCCKECKDRFFHKEYDQQEKVKALHNVRAKDRYKSRDKEKFCQECGSEENVEIHHITYDLENNYIKFLCRNCHRKLHRSFI